MPWERYLNEGEGCPRSEEQRERDREINRSEKRAMRIFQKGLLTKNLSSYTRLPIPGKMTFSMTLVRQSVLSAVKLKTVSQDRSDEGTPGSGAWSLGDEGDARLQRTPGQLGERLLVPPADGRHHPRYVDNFPRPRQRRSRGGRATRKQSHMTLKNEISLFRLIQQRSLLRKPIDTRANPLLCGCCEIRFSTMVTQVTPFAGTWGKTQ